MAKLIVGVNDLLTTNPEIAKEWDYDKNASIQPSDVTAGSKQKVWWKCSVCGYEWETTPAHRTQRGQGCPYCAGKRFWKGHNDFQTLRPDLAKEWDYEKNHPIKPGDVLARSRQKYWWICPTCGLSYQTACQGRFSGTGCPVCGRKKAVESIQKHSLNPTNLLSVKYPLIASEWNYQKNGVLTPSSVSANSGKKVWWKCHICGNEWEATINMRTRSSSTCCPLCVRKNRGDYVHKGYLRNGSNSLLIHNPELCKEWNYDRNKDCSPESVTPNSSKTVWWKCNSCGHEWQSPISNRNKGSGCPNCNFVYKTSFPEQAIFFYIHNTFPDAINGWALPWRPRSEYDVYIPSLKLGIEYDGERWHQNVAKDIRKNEEAKTHGIQLIRIREPLCPSLPEQFVQIITGDPLEGGYSYLEKAINELLALIKKKTKTDVSFQTVDLANDSNDIIAAFTISKKERALSSQYPEAFSDWDGDKNLPLTPDLVTSGSKIKVWWKCHVCGYEWKAQVGSRVSGRGCPACANKIVWKGHNDLATIRPDLIEDWDYSKNLECTPDTVTVGSGKDIWWKCHVCGYEWKSKIVNRGFSRAGCPYCAGKTVWKGHNDLASNYPEIASEWSAKNTEQPENYSCGSSKQVWWKCNKCGFEWETSISVRTSGHGCPRCAGKVVIEGQNDIASKGAALVSEWDYEKNGTLTPDIVSIGSGKKVWWKCTRCGNSYQATPSSRSYGKTGCPYCAGKKVQSGYNDLGTTHPELVKEWSFEKNTVQPWEVSKGSSKKVWWKCHICGNEWEATIAKRTSGRGCPKCKANNARKRRQRMIKCIETGQIYDSVSVAKEATGITTISDCLNH